MDITLIRGASTGSSDCEHDIVPRECFTKNKDGGIQGLPVEIVLKISGYLSPAAKACLALTCRSMLFTLGSQAIQLNETDRMAFLTILDENGCYPGHILCRDCRIFHALPPSNILSPIEPWRLSLQARHDAGCIVTGILRCSRLNLSLLGPELLNSEVEFRARSGPILYRQTLGRVVDGRLVQKTEVLVTPAHDNPGYSTTMGMLRLAESNNPICFHSSWVRHSPDNHFGKPWPQYIYRTYSSAEEEADAKKQHKIDQALHECLWTHPGGCQCSGDSRKGMSAIRGCQHCRTDFTFNVKSSEKGLQSLVLTSWRDLGSGRWDDDTWDRFTPANTLNNEGLREGYHAVGSIATRFETLGLFPGDYREFVYRASFNELQNKFIPYWP